MNKYKHYNGKVTTVFNFIREIANEIQSVEIEKYKPSSYCMNYNKKDAEDIRFREKLDFIPTDILKGVIEKRRDSEISAEYDPETSNVRVTYIYGCQYNFPISGIISLLTSAKSLSDVPPKIGSYAGIRMSSLKDQKELEFKIGEPFAPLNDDTFDLLQRLDTFYNLTEYNTDSLYLVRPNELEIVKERLEFLRSVELSNIEWAKKQIDTPKDIANVKDTKAFVEIFTKRLDLIDNFDLSYFKHSINNHNMYLWHTWIRRAAKRAHITWFMQSRDFDKSDFVQLFKLISFFGLENTEVFKQFYKTTKPISISYTYKAMKVAKLLTGKISIGDLTDLNYKKFKSFIMTEYPTNCAWSLSDELVNKSDIYSLQDKKPKYWLTNEYDFEHIKKLTLELMKLPTNRKYVDLDTSKPITVADIKELIVPDCFGKEFDRTDQACVRCHDEEICGILFKDTVDKKADRVITATGQMSLDVANFDILEDKKDKLVQLLKDRAKADNPMSIMALMDWLKKTSKCSDIPALKGYFKRLITENGLTTFEGFVYERS